ncbi:hypothetical protein CDEF62S_05740 [Castellaniella defragrans]
MAMRRDEPGPHTAGRHLRPETRCLHRAQWPAGGHPGRTARRDRPQRRLDTGTPGVHLGALHATAGSRSDRPAAGCLLHARTREDPQLPSHPGLAELVADLRPTWRNAQVDQRPQGPDPGRARGLDPERLPAHCARRPAHPGAAGRRANPGRRLQTRAEPAGRRRGRRLLLWRTDVTEVRAHGHAHHLSAAADLLRHPQGAQPAGPGRHRPPPRGLAVRSRLVLLPHAQPVAHPLPSPRAPGGRPLDHRRAGRTAPARVHPDAELPDPAWAPTPAPAVERAPLRRHPGQHRRLRLRQRSGTALPVRQPPA